MRRSEWRELYALRDELEDERDRRLVRRFIKYAERLEILLRKYEQPLDEEDDNE
jgi:hypothetical protein